MTGAGPDAEPSRIVGVDVVLRDTQPQDVDDYVRWYTVDREWERWDAPWESLDESAETVRRRFSSYVGPKRAHPRMRFEIGLRSGEHAGRVLRYRSTVTEPWSVGIDLFEPRHWGRGYGTEALLLWAGYLARHGIARLRCTTWSGNVRMTALASRAGFRVIERHLGERVVDGLRWDRVVFERP